MLDLQTLEARTINTAAKSQATCAGYHHGSPAVPAVGCSDELPVGPQKTSKLSLIWVTYRVPEGTMDASERERKKSKGWHSTGCYMLWYSSTWQDVPTSAVVEWWLWEEPSDFWLNARPVSQRDWMPATVSWSNINEEGDLRTKKKNKALILLQLHTVKSSSKYWYIHM